MKEKPQNEIVGQQGVFIDIDKILRRKSKKFYPFIPGFIKNYLKKIVHQDELNEFLSNNAGKRNFEFLESVLFGKLEVEVEVHNLDLLPVSGRAILVSNHPMGGFDGMALMHAIGKKRKDLKILINDLLMEVEPLRDLFVPVNKFGKSTVETVRILDEVFEDEGLVVFFPAGLVSRKQKGGVIKDLEWKKTFVSKAIRYQRDVIPVHISGQNSIFFYNLARWRKRLGIKFNIEMLYLVDEMAKQYGKKIEITFGKAIPFTTFTDLYTHKGWAGMLREFVYQMPSGETKFR